jgi:3-deoxy-D-arabino-heptulosonate 7-phosphate (DAHP) synthase class II
VRDTGHPVVWACDPMHGNTYTNPGGRKTRSFDAILGEVEGFVRAHRSQGTWPGGIHIELTGDDVTECVGGAKAVTDRHSPGAAQDVLARFITEGDRLLAIQEISDLIGRYLLWKFIVLSVRK